MEISSFFQFIQKGYNPLLALTALVSGGMLLWPLLRRSTGGPWVDAARAIQLINREDALVLDVREPTEYDAGHVLGAKNLPLGSLEARAGELDKHKTKPVIVLCGSEGTRASKAAAMLREKGFAKVVSLSGGFPAWQQAGLPVVK